MKKSVSVLLILMLLASMFTGCASPAAIDAEKEPEQTPATDAEPQTPDTPAEPEETSAFPMTVTDQVGNSVTLDAPAECIVSGYYISSSTCIALGLKNKLVGTEEKTDARPIYKLAAPELIGAVANV